MRTGEKRNHSTGASSLTALPTRIIMPVVGVDAILKPLEYAHIAVDVASDKQASDILLLDIREISDFADYFVVLTAESARQIENLAEDLEGVLEARGATVHHREGGAQSGWVLLDFSDVIVHLFSPEKREFYDIEGAWSRGVEVVRIQ